MENESPTVRKLFQILIYLAIQRCRLSGVLCRLTASLKCFQESKTPSVHISISDTGVGSSLEEFLTMDVGTFLPPWDKWDGLLSITTTSINEKDIHHYRLNLKEKSSSKVRLKRLLSTSKHSATFSGTEVRLSTSEENIDELVTWVVHFVQKIFVLKAQDILVDLSVEHMDTQDSRQEHFVPKTENLSSALPSSVSTSNIECLCSGLEEYVLAQRGCRGVAACSVCSRENLKIGRGHASKLETTKKPGKAFDVAIVIAPCCSSESSQTTEVLYYRNFSPSSIPEWAASTLEGIKWQAYGLRLKEIVVDGDGHAVLRWEDLPLAHIDKIAVHNYDIKILPASGGRETAEKKLLRKAASSALDDLKAKCAEVFLSSHARKIQKHAPELSRSIAHLIASSRDEEFIGECASLLGIQPPNDSDIETMIERRVEEKLVEIICMNDANKFGRDLAPDLFECEEPSNVEEDGLQEEDEEEGDDFGALDC